MIEQPKSKTHIELLKDIIKSKDAIIKHYEKRLFDLEKCLELWQKEEVIQKITYHSKVCPYCEFGLDEYSCICKEVQNENDNCRK